MNEKLDQYLTTIFAPYEAVKSVAELKADLLADLQERYRELKAEGKDDDTAFQMTVDSIGDIEQTLQEVADQSRSQKQQPVINFNASNLPESDFAGVTAQNRSFKSSALRGSDFSGADLTGSTFATSDIREANFDGANLTDCKFSVSDLRDTSFRRSVLVRTHFNTSDLTGTKFADVPFTDVTLTMIDLKKSTFERCSFNGVAFKYTDLSGMRLDGLTFVNVTFNNAGLKNVSFKGAILKNVSFLAKFSITNKFYRAIKTADFDGARIDKLTYAALKGMGADVSRATVL
ncbi:pentapeptide repeat-containing protein [Sporolactobacillus vineae]|uniref:pentapeptide repeat-containing protein n=1 Tax=Sporolactobacillus vineae TaxID=444463 RepID=UPI000287F4A8|nr:pentapeptide repeat-containing protein [Sporolactobacillus vineae]